MLLYLDYMLFTHVPRCVAAAFINDVCPASAGKPEGQWSAGEGGVYRNFIGDICVTR